MAQSLDAWQERLDRHFRELAVARATSGFPIFALEHGLAPAEVSEIADQLRSRLVTGAGLGPHWLLWAVYATEQGYDYDGHEYWVSFEENTPRWRDFASAVQLRGYFTKFQSAYHGVAPTGPWADWFKNIAWPITHAILPRYLQIQFAGALYEASHELARLHPLTPKAAGQQLANHAWNATSRFREFLEQDELAGRIVLALLGQGSVAGQSPIYAPTLDRIVADLERVRSAGEWLKEARRVVADHFRGVSRLAPAPGRVPSEPRQAALPPDVRPVLSLRRTGGQSWAAVIELPSFAGVARLSPQLGDFLKTTRCRIAAVGIDPFPRGWLLAGDQRRVLRSWPAENQTVVSFERRDALLEAILQKDCRISSGPRWLFRVASDGTAREIVGHLVRPGQTYILVSREPQTTDAPFCTIASIECAGVSARSIALPDVVTAGQIEQMRKLGLEVSRSVRLWPAGLAIREWDGEGRGEWLTTETPCFGVVHDHPVDEYRLRLNNGPETVIEGRRAGEAAFVRLQSLPPGRHVLTVKAHRFGVSLSPQGLKDLEGKVDLVVRDPAPWTPGAIGHSGLALILDPPDPSLDVLWEGNVAVSLLGPAGRSVTTALTLRRRDGTVLMEHSLGAFDLPITPVGWASRFKSVTSDDSRALKYAEAASGVLVFDGEELGRYAIALERERRPLRWAFRHDPRTTRVILYDDTGLEEPVELVRYPLGRPETSAELSREAAQVGIEVEEPGALFVARLREHADGLVVSSSHRALGLHDLLVEPSLPAISTDNQILARLVSLDLWNGARLAGPLADSRRGHIVRRLKESVYSSLYGTRWSEAEKAFLEASASPLAVQRLVSAVGSQSFAVVVQRGANAIASGPDEAARWFCEVAGRYAIAQDNQLCVFALRLALSPFNLSAVFGSRTNTLLTEARQHPALLRGARLAALVSGTEETGELPFAVRRWA
jgi:hypothetical protein